jgi:hypothetical protein
VFEFPFPVQGFQFVAGAKNGTVPLTVVYDDETTAEFPVDGTCCEAIVQVMAPEGLTIVSFSLPADPDLWLFDSLEWVGSLPVPEPTEVETTLTETSVQPENSSSSTSPSSSSVSTVLLPPDTQTTVETTSPETSLPETTVATTLPAPATTPPTTTPPTTTPPTTTTLAPLSDTTMPPEASGSVLSDANPDPVVDTGVIEQPPSDASLEQKLDFESKVNLFSGAYDNYIPVGSTITVAQRRTVVAATAVLIMFAPPPSKMRRK